MPIRKQDRRRIGPRARSSIYAQEVSNTRYFLRTLALTKPFWHIVVVAFGCLIVNQGSRLFLPKTQGPSVHMSVTCTCPCPRRSWSHGHGRAWFGGMGSGEVQASDWGWHSLRCLYPEEHSQMFGVLCRPSGKEGQRDECSQNV